MSESFRVQLEKQSLVFSAAHFITFGDNICERIHGHNWGVRAEVCGPINEHGYVVDFIALRDALAAMVAELDHRVLLPTNHPTIAVHAGEREVEVTFEDRRWVFPREDCAILPIPNTTAELLASYLGGRMREWIFENEAGGLDRLSLAIDENHGQWGVWECELGHD